MTQLPVPLEDIKSNKRSVLRSCALGIVFLFFGIILFGVCPRMNDEIRMEDYWNCSHKKSSIVEALDTYAVDHKCYPSSLQEIDPKYLREIPHCPKRSGEWVYRTADKRHYSIYCDYSEHKDDKWEGSLDD